MVFVFVFHGVDIGAPAIDCEGSGRHSLVPKPAFVGCDFRFFFIQDVYATGCFSAPRRCGSFSGSSAPALQVIHVRTHGDEVNQMHMASGQRTLGAHSVDADVFVDGGACMVGTGCEEDDGCDDEDGHDSLWGHGRRQLRRDRVSDPGMKLPHLWSFQPLAGGGARPCRVGCS